MAYESGYSDSISMPNVHKMGTGEGERMLALYVEGNGSINEKVEYFSDISSYIVTKKDLEVYLRMSYEEYHHRTRTCHDGFDYRDLYEKNLCLVQSLDKSILHLHYSVSERNNGTQVYLNLTSSDDVEVFKQYLWPILIPNQQSPRIKYTKFSLTKIRLYNSNFIYMKPEFKKEYSTSELVEILKRYLSDESKPKDVTLHKFIVRMCYFIENANQLADICEQLELSKYTEDAKRCLQVCKELIDEKVDLDLSELKLPHETSNNGNKDATLQKIFYGAPGTGKSNTIKRDVEEAGKIHFRTTFHPDSDYSTFVGCYKPSMKTSEKKYSQTELVLKLKEIKNTGVTYPCQKFATKYWESLQDLSADEIKQIITACGFTDSMVTEVSKGIAIGQDILNKPEEGKIIYAFTSQAFTNAYIKAWSTTEEVYLIIEEINRGNCAQIFGDLFQLLDRKGGFSEYPVDADTDLGNFIAEKLADSPRTEGWREGVKEGKKLVLPDNLYIWATMNTSDQSLFPIDSAFKRRWEWKYMPIKPHPEMNYSVEIESAKYDWWGFLDKINNVIGDTTSSEDKKMGYFFVTPANKKVTAEQFVGKVLFYLWNDVFKNYGFDNPIFNKGDKKHFAFSDFFLTDGKPNTENVNKFLRKLDETIDKEHPFEIKEAEPEEAPEQELADSKETQRETPQAEA